MNNRKINRRRCERPTGAKQSYKSQLEIASSLASIWSGLVSRNDFYFYKFFSVLVVLVYVAGCDSKISERIYEQVVIEAPQQNMSMLDPHAGLGLDKAPINVQGQASEHGLSWDVPKGWNEIPGSGMRVVTFKNAQDPDAIDVSIITLSGEAGGLVSNLIRWANQIGVDLQEDQEKLNQFIQGAESVKTKAGATATLFDFSKIQDPSASSKSTVASMLSVGDSTIFVKMTGTVKSVAENLEPFKLLTRSLREQ